MMEKLNEASEELKRVEHLIYVSLKYTRTVDVIINILNRMVDGYSCMVDALIMYAVQEGKVQSEPESAIERAMLVRQLYSADDVVVDNMDLYLLLRKLLRARSVERENEYRRHVTMKTIIEGREEIVNIDIITNYHLYQRDFLSYVRNIIEGKETVVPLQQEFTVPETPSWMTSQKEEPSVVVEEMTKSARPSLPPTRQPMKIRPVTAPPRKRAPRPKKYKIQIPKGKNPIMNVPYSMRPRPEPPKPAVKEAVSKPKPKRAKSPKKAAKKKR